MEFSKAANYLTFIWLISIMFHMGLSHSFRSLFSSINNPKLLLKCVVANYVAVPLMALALLIYFQPNPMLSLGFLIIISLAGAPFAPAMVRIAKGDEALATGLMLFLTLLSVLLAPFILAQMYEFLTQSHTVSLNRIDILKVLVKGQLAPLCLGLAIGSCWESLKVKIVKPLKTITDILMGIALILVFYTEFNVFAHFGTEAFIGMFCLSGFSMAVGWIFGGTETAKLKSMILLTGTRNAAAALTIASTSFSGTETPLAVVIYSLVSLIVAFIASVLLGRWNRE